MTDKTKVTPRARFWSNQKVVAANRVRAMRALDRAVTREPRASQISRRMAARTFWRRRYLWEAEPAV